MLLAKSWENERNTLHRLSQILGKHKLSCMFKEPQWAHIILDVTTEGFSTGMLYYDDFTYTMTVNLLKHRIEIITNKDSKYIALEDGKTIQTYDKEIEEALAELGINVTINKVPQEVEETTTFDEDEIHHHYKPEIMGEVLELMQYAMKVEQRFINGFRTRKVKPGLFWGTFDIACLINYDKEHHTFDESMVIESNAFDEHFIEFGFWFGDKNFDKPTFFILPYPFVDKDFKHDGELPEGAYFDENLTEFVLSIDDKEAETSEKIQDLFQAGYHIFGKHLGWDNLDHATIPLRIEDNLLEGRIKRN